MSQDASPTFYSWEYLGEEKLPDAMDNIQTCKTGATLKHDVFGLCKLLDCKEAASGSFKVRVLADNREGEYTQGHFQLIENVPDDSSTLPPQQQQDVDMDGNAAPEPDEGGATADTLKSSADDSDGAFVPQPELQSELDENTGNGDGSDGGAPEPTPESKPEENLKPAEDEIGDADKGKSEEGLAKSETVPLEQVINSLAMQANEFNLDIVDGKTDIIFFKNMAMIDTPAVLDKPVGQGGKPRLEVGAVVRELGTGCFLVVCKILKPLLGYLVTPEAGVVVDAGGESQTIMLAKSSRMLGGNSGCFSADRDCLLICMSCKRFGQHLWAAASASKLESVFDLTPSPEDINMALGFKDDLDRQEYAANAPAQWVQKYQKTISTEEVHGGGQCIDEGVLKTVLNLYGNYKRRRAKPYRTKSEREADEAERVAAAAAATAEKLERTRRRGGERGGRGAAAGGRKGGRGGAKRGRTARSISVLSEDEGEEGEEGEGDGQGVGRRPGLRARPTIAVPAPTPAAPSPGSALPPTGPKDSNVRAKPTQQPHFTQQPNLTQQLNLTQPPNVFQQPTNVFQQPPNVFQQPPNVFQQPPNVFQQPPNVFQQQPNVFQQQPNVFQQQPNAAQQPSNAAQQPPNAAQQPNASQQPNLFQQDANGGVAMHLASVGKSVAFAKAEAENMLPNVQQQQRQFQARELNSSAVRAHNTNINMHEQHDSTFQNARQHASEPHGMEQHNVRISIPGAGTAHAFTHAHFGTPNHPNAALSNPGQQVPYVFLGNGAVSPGGPAFVHQYGAYNMQSVGASAHFASPAQPPSLAAIHARINFNKKREADLIEAQAMHEYYMQLYGLPP